MTKPFLLNLPNRGNFQTDQFKRVIFKSSSSFLVIFRSFFLIFDFVFKSNREFSVYIGNLASEDGKEKKCDVIKQGTENILIKLLSKSNTKYVFKNEMTWEHPSTLPNISLLHHLSGSEEMQDLEGEAIFQSPSKEETKEKRVKKTKKREEQTHVDEQKEEIETNAIEEEEPKSVEDKREKEEEDLDPFEMEFVKSVSSKKRTASSLSKSTKKTSKISAKKLKISPLKNKPLSVIILFVVVRES
eukprot:TRINITY_DN3583_c0_g1_i3.p1 TRINITY_DN3583_c0_g1~~TRINITY_DN3583_c0_g1_i3.p1  ORF type:complete len:244 (+),score=87.84 TRINITY_DN3583_c0_g1_i3:480-1211(+)